ncbi:MAG: ATP-binding cassette domain-containing protein, partial [Gemmatimonadaceae bacterium]|nr:ATP-binding cassette domain-containing protein [Acetobacteraceae bacterium]
MTVSTTKKRPSLSALRVLLPFLRPYAGRAVGAAVTLALAAGLVLLLGQGVRRLIDDGFSAGDAGHLNQAALIMFAVVAGLGIATGLRFYLMSWLGERVAADLRAALFGRVLGLSPAFFETMRTGDVLTRLTNDTSQLQGLVGSAVSQWLRSGLIASGALIMLIVTSPKLALLVVAVIPLVVLPLVLFGRRERALSRNAQDRIADLGAYAEETVNALRTVQAFTHETVDRARFGTRVEASIGAALRRARVRAVLILAVILLGFGAITLSLWVGGLEVVNGRMSGGELSAFVFYAILMATSVTGMSELWGEVQRAAGSADRIAELLAEQPAIAAPAHPVRLPEAAGLVEFDAVSFRYPSRPETSALDAFSLRVEPGETVALVGPSGAGKTTVFQMLLRFYDPADGRVLLDGVDVRTADPEAVRARIGLVSQDPVIFGADVWDNIRYGRPDASDADVRAAARAASAGFLDELPQGFDTFLGERGVRLSGGQRQRVAIARALLRDAPVLLLDEATSALDAESEAAVQHALNVLSTGRTTLVIAHRLATVRRADRIVVMDAGRVVATGPHEALVRQ